MLEAKSARQKGWFCNCTRFSLKAWTPQCKPPLHHARRQLKLLRGVEMYSFGLLTPFVPPMSLIFHHFSIWNGGFEQLLRHYITRKTWPVLCFHEAVIWRCEYIFVRCSLHVVCSCCSLIVVLDPYIAPLHPCFPSWSWAFALRSCCASRQRVSLTQAANFQVARTSTTSKI